MKRPHTPGGGGLWGSTPEIIRQSSSRQEFAGIQERQKNKDIGAVRGFNVLLVS